MKTRNGFVSNSSSSSFVILGEEVDINNITVDELKNKKKKYQYIAETGISYEGSMIVDINDKKMLDVLKRADAHEFDEFERIEGDIRVYKAFFTSSDDGDDTKVITANLPEELRLYVFTVDQHSPNSAEELEQMYKNEY